METARYIEPAVDPTLDSCRVCIPCIVYNIQARVRFETKFNASCAIYRTNRLTLTVVNPLCCRRVRWCRLAGYGRLRMQRTATPTQDVRAIMRVGRTRSATGYQS